MHKTILNPWDEYDAAALQLAQEGKSGAVGCPLPANMTPEAVALINDDPDAFVERVRLSAYALAQRDQPHYSADDKRLAEGEESLPALDQERELWDAEPNCKHEMDPRCYSGVKCLKCGGWFCY